MNISPLKITILGESEDKSNIIYNIKGIPTGIIHGLANLYRQGAYNLGVGIAPIGFKLLGVTRITDISPQFKESVRDIGMNISKININNSNSKYIKLYFKGMVDNVLTSDMLKSDVQGVNILDKNIHILTVSSPQEVSLEITFMCGRGVLRSTDKVINETSSSENNFMSVFDQPDFIRITANFSPVKLFKYNIIDSEIIPGTSELKIDITTNGTQPASNIMSYVTIWLNEYKLILSDIQNVRQGELVQTETDTEEVGSDNTINKIPEIIDMIEMLDLDMETYNKLKEDYNINSIRELIDKTPELTDTIKSKVIESLEKSGFTVYENNK